MVFIPPCVLAHPSRRLLGLLEEAQLVVVLSHTLLEALLVQRRKGCPRSKVECDKVFQVADLAIEGLLLVLRLSELVVERRQSEVVLGRLVARLLGLLDRHIRLRHSLVHLVLGRSRRKQLSLLGFLGLGQTLLVVLLPHLRLRVARCLHFLDPSLDGVLPRLDVVELGGGSLLVGACCLELLTLLCDECASGDLQLLLDSVALSVHLDLFDELLADLGSLLVASVLALPFNLIASIAAITHAILDKVGADVLRHEPFVNTVKLSVGARRGPRLVAPVQAVAIVIIDPIPLDIFLLARELGPALHDISMLIIWVNTLENFVLICCPGDTKEA
mmetsp:Transcript_37653/g.87993  ORF Transcript_37653/g.87993 Transcript_37653/m.87993 type:complete len:332 (-) Transcript_37653:40-1035(-)